MSRKSDKNAHLLVEGKNDQHVIWALCKMHQVRETFDVLTPKEGGIEALLEDIPIRLKEPDLQSLGIVIDADEDIQARWASVRNRLREAQYSVPDKPAKRGFITSPPGRPRVGVWVMPDNQISGILEDFVAHLIPTTDSLRPVAEDTLQTIEQGGLHRYRPSYRPKAFIHTWLAWQETPGMPMGLAITARALQHNPPLANRFVTWLKKLFDA